MEQSTQITKKNSELYDKYLCGFQKDIKRKDVKKNISKGLE